MKQSQEVLLDSEEVLLDSEAISRKFKIQNINWHQNALPIKFASMPSSKTGQCMYHVAKLLHMRMCMSVNFFSIVVRYGGKQLSSCPCYTGNKQVAHAAMMCMVPPAICIFTVMD